MKILFCCGVLLCFISYVSGESGKVTVTDEFATESNPSSFSEKSLRGLKQDKGKHVGGAIRNEMGPNSRFLEDQAMCMKATKDLLVAGLTEAYTYMGQCLPFPEKMALATANELTLDQLNEFRKRDIFRDGYLNDTKDEHSRIVSQSLKYVKQLFGLEKLSDITYRAMSSDNVLCFGVFFFGVSVAPDDFDVYKSNSLSSNDKPFMGIAFQLDTPMNEFNDYCGPVSGCPGGWSYAGSRENGFQCTRPYSEQCNYDCAKSQCLDQTGKWSDLESPYTCYFGEVCPAGFTRQDLGENGVTGLTCEAHWTPDCDEGCHRGRCSSVGGFFPNLDYSSNPYKCYFGPACPDGWEAQGPGPDGATCLTCTKQKTFPFLSDFVVSPICTLNGGRWANRDYGKEPWTCYFPETHVSTSVCPSGYIQVFGTLQDINGWGEVDGAGDGQQVTSAQECSKLCSEREACKSFEYSPSEKKCNLNTGVVPDSPAYNDYQLCRKKGCPQGYMEATGDFQDIPGFGMFAADAETSNDCAKLCDAHYPEGSCQSYEYSPSTKRCHLNDSKKPTVVRNEDFDFCKKITTVRCADGYYRETGAFQDVFGFGVVDGKGGDAEVGTVTNCANLCSTTNAHCKSYEYSPSKRTCNLNTEAEPTLPRHEDYDFCRKIE